MANNLAMNRLDWQGCSEQASVRTPCKALDVHKLQGWRARHRNVVCAIGV
jgi:hypothetical protein